uniref:CEP295 N-terminal like n=1 Tax=Jaculus jaculus TaxID=51337 RepID=A0A8C5KS09_JACJA
LQRGMEKAAELSAASGEEALALRPKPTLLQVRDKGDVTLKQWKTRQLEHLTEELKAELQEARLQQVRDLERLYLARLLDEAAGRRAVGNDLDLEEPVHRGTARSLRTKERQRIAMREERAHREEPSRQQAWHPKSRKKAAGSERRASKARGSNPSEKVRGKRAPLSKTGGGYQPVGPRMGRGTDLAKLNPLLAGSGETKYKEEAQKEAAREGRRQVGKGTSHFQSSQGKVSNQEELWPPDSPYKQGSASPGSLRKPGDKNQLQREIESAFEELFNTNRKLKKHLSLHLEQRLKVDQTPDEQQSVSELQGQGSDPLREENVGETDTAPAEETGRSLENNLKQLLSETEYPRYQQMSKCALKRECLTPIAEMDSPSNEEDLLSLNPETGCEPPKVTSLAEETLEPHLQKQVDLSDWVASRLKQKTELEQRRQKALLGLTEHPDMSLEIHYKAELEEERKARRKMRLALLKSYPTGTQSLDRSSELRTTSLLDSDLLQEEDKQNQMIRDLQQQILEKNNLHKQFLEKARKRLQEFQNSF